MLFNISYCQLYKRNNSNMFVNDCFYRYASFKQVFRTGKHPAGRVFRRDRKFLRRRIPVFPAPATAEPSSVSIRQRNTGRASIRRIDATGTATSRTSRKKTQKWKSGKPPGSTRKKKEKAVTRKSTRSTRPVDRFPARWSSGVRGKCEHLANMSVWIVCAKFCLKKRCDVTQTNVVLVKLAPPLLHYLSRIPI